MRSETVKAPGGMVGDSAGARFFIYGGQKV